MRFSGEASRKDVPTAVLVHGILGSKRNLNSFARMIAEVRTVWRGGAGQRRRVRRVACLTACTSRQAAACGGLFVRRDALIIPLLLLSAHTHRVSPHGR